MFAYPSEKALRVMTIDLFRDHQLAQKDLHLVPREVLFLDSVVVNTAAHFFRQLRIVTDVGREQHLDRLLFVLRMLPQAPNGREGQITDHRNGMPHQNLHNRDNPLGEWCI